MYHGAGMSQDIRRFVRNINPVLDTAEMYDVFERIRLNPEISFIPVVGPDLVFCGIIREIDLRAYAFGMFGREIIKKEKIQTFLRSCHTIDITASVEEILSIGSKNTDDDGLVVMDNNRYAGVIFNDSLLAMFEEYRMETHKRLAMAQKMEAIGTLAGGIAHDFNNILMPLMGYAELLNMRIDKNDSIKLGYVDQILTAANRAKELVKQILAFGRQSGNDPYIIGISSIVKEVVKLLKFSIPSTIKIAGYFNADNDRVLADPTEIHQILMNLCTNASHAMRENGGTLTIDISEYYGKVSCRHSACDELEGSFVTLTVSDTGYGISQSIINRIFDPFFTTKKQGEGTGMGLSVVHGIVKKYHGTIDVESSPDEGTTFKIYLPQIKADRINPSILLPSVNNKNNVSDNSMNGDEKLKVMYVDDETMIIELAEAAMEDSGFSVATFEDSFKALAAFEKEPDAYDVVVTDQTMPNLTGMSLAKRILQIRPDIPIILCTGYSEIVSVEMAKAIGIKEYVMKPVDFSRLISIIINHLKN
jgi:two-component system, cell cycle sensor histidine kinase and response regulator CckA